MQLFSQYLRDLLQAKGLTVSALSRLSGVERTALSKTLTGQRVLPYAALDDLIPRVEISFVLDRLDYMKKGGRCSAVTALGANLLKLHPCIEVIDGKMSVVKKYRGSMEKVVGEYVRERLNGRTDIDTSRVFLVDTCRTPGLTQLARQILEEDGRFGEIIQGKVGCTVFCHCGPDTLGLVFLRK